MAFHNYQCRECETVLTDISASHQGYSVSLPCPRCETETTFDILWRRLSSPHSVHPRERAVVYRHPQTGKVMFPPRNDVPMPERYQKAGYERVELTTLRDIHRLERDTGTLSEKAWFDDGTGRGHETEPPDIPAEVVGMLERGEISIRRARR